jgi:DNA-binding transcriptional LysR family regulator
MNVHHLELLYHVAKHGGVSAAARLMPYGIQQPAISAQILQLEDSLGVTLFQRRPFKLTREGAELVAFITPFFGGLETLANKLRGGTDRRLRIGTPEIVQRDYLPSLLKRMQTVVPGFQFSLFPGTEDQIITQLRSQDLEIGLCTLTSKRPEGMQWRPLVRLPMVLLVQEKSRITDAAEILQRDRIAWPLVSVPGEETLSRLFQKELQKRKIDWFAAVEVPGLDMVGRYVQEGFGVGLAFGTPGVPLIRGIRALPLKGFPLVTFGAIWLGKLASLGALFLAEAAKLGKELSASASS